MYLPSYRDEEFMLHEEIEEEDELEQEDLRDDVSDFNDVSGIPEVESSLIRLRGCERVSSHTIDVSTIQLALRTLSNRDILQSKLDTTNSLNVNHDKSEPKLHSFGTSHIHGTFHESILFIYEFVNSKESHLIDNKRFIKFTSRDLLVYINSLIDKQQCFHPEDDISYDINSLRLRDLRRLDFHFNPIDEPNIIVRKHVVLMSFDPIRALVMADRLLLIVPDGADNLLKILEDYMDEWNMQIPTTASLMFTSEDKINETFEKHIFDALLATALHCQNEQYQLLRQSIHEIVDIPKTNSQINLNIQLSGSLPIKDSIRMKKGMIDDNTANDINITYQKNVESDLVNRFDYAIVSIEEQEELKRLKKLLQLLLHQVESQKKCITKVLEDDELMSFMNLSYFSYDKLRNKDVEYLHSFIEDIIELFPVELISLEARITNKIAQVQHYEDMIQFRLATAENELLFSETANSILTCTIGLGTFMVGMMGMNLDQVPSALGINIESIKYLFYILFAVALFLVGGMFYIEVIYYRYIGSLPRGLFIRSLTIALFRIPFQAIYQCFNNIRSFW